MRGLYVIVDLGALAGAGLPVVPFVERVIAANPAALQVRAKESTSRAFLDVLTRVVPLCRAASVPCFVNDRPDLAVLSGADGVHVGQEDLEVREIRRFAAHLRVGVSTHDLAQLGAALEGRPDYVALGPVFPTRSKEKPDPVVGVATLARAGELCRAAGIPLVAIGGIDLARAPEVAPHADCAAVIGALVPSDGNVEGVTPRAVDLSRALRVAR